MKKFIKVLAGISICIWIGCLGISVEAKGIDTILQGVYIDNLDLSGMTEAELVSLRSKLTRPCKETDSGFGLANVNERIRMNYGSEYGVTINSKQGEGTWVRIVIPAQSIEE